MVQFMSKSDKGGAGADAYEPEGSSEEPPQYQPPQQSQYQAPPQYQPPRQPQPQQHQVPPQQQQRKSVPPMPDNAFKVGDEAEDDIPF